ncbi:DUF3626 domain-containing protein [Paenibacillus thiaminolyticus]|uniref:DUF3626 domain-containing protein n=1 Tax=Paenibacillus thiaminolyticus TaxID=49283 RepID=UPI0026914DB5
MVEPFHSKPALTRAQAQAIQLVLASASQMRQYACERIERHLTRAGFPSATLRDILAAVRESVRMTVNFHPDRLFADGSLVVDGLLRDGVYRCQFETGVTSASLTAYPGGDRDRWERRLFGRLSSGRDSTPGAPEIRGAEPVAAPRRGRAEFRLLPCGAAQLYAGPMHIYARGQLFRAGA